LTTLECFQNTGNLANIFSDDLKTPIKILLAPLDWGLGHTTRCIPIIRYLIEKGCVVVVAAEGASAMLLKSNFPDITILPLAGYRIRYSRHAGTFAIKIIAQIPRILRAVQQEKRWLRREQARNSFDLVISDNRYGLKIAGLPAVIMTHQLQIKSGQGAMVDRILRVVHYQILGKFDRCWVVDAQSDHSIGGELSQPSRIPSNARYIGLLSQLGSSRQIAKQGQVLVLLSGPEPQRSLLERKILSQITPDATARYTIIGGNPGGVIPDGLPAGIAYYTHLNASELERHIDAAELVVCRSGYSTLMDLAVMGKKALLIPTPGQSEQEYLAKYLERRGLFLSVKQSELNLDRDTARAFELPGFATNVIPYTDQEMKIAVDEILSTLRPLRYQPII
jgi:UDP-N-acetylglucosamine transferase subunit ALG13